MKRTVTWRKGITIKEVEKEIYLRSLEMNKGDKRKVAESLGVSVKTVFNKINKYKNE